ncbi:MAG TPA: hypothetical protein VLK85_04630 [Ramlibacter sp.]|nr:hypothetical protein [Ramlibacter sp.]
MIVKVAREEALARRHRFVTPTGVGGFVNTYIGTNRLELKAQGLPADAAPVGPMANLVEQDPLSTVQPHFHGVDQFQVFVGGGGKIGIHDVEPVTVHFAGPHSPYGPIVAGPEGVQYLTLRPGWDTGAQWMPQSAPKLRSLPDRKHVAFTSGPLELCKDPAGLTGTSSTEVMAPESPGAAGAWLRRAGPGNSLRADATGSQGQFWYVLAGALQVEGGALGAGGCIYIGADEPATEFRAGAGGVEILQVQFPRRETQQGD